MKTLRRWWLALVVAACSSEQVTPAREEPRDTTLPRAVDLNPAPGAIEINLEAAPTSKQYLPGTTTTVSAYNGTIPGPLIDARVGDRLRVNFRNSLAQPTTIHWHGVRLPATMDGSLAMQNPIAPGATFTYEFTFRDAGLYWYHPHVTGDLQVHRGLYGIIRVRGADEPAVDHEEIVVLGDVKLKPDGSIDEYLDDNSRMLGREGRIVVNGAVTPRFRVRAGSRVRLRVLNVANGRFFNLKIPGHTLTVLGTDGGFYPKPLAREQLVIVPGERYDVMIVPRGDVGSEIPVINTAYDRGHDTAGRADETIASLVIDGAASDGGPLPTAMPSATPLPDRPVDQTLALGEKLLDGNMLFTVNDRVYPDVPPIVVPTDAVRAFEVKNTSEMDHPFHLHGAFFQVVSRNGVAVPAAELIDKDTVIVPQKSSIKLLARYDAASRGKWMYHCHILEHAEGGMMGEVHVE